VCSASPAYAAWREPFAVSVKKSMPRKDSLVSKSYCEPSSMARIAFCVYGSNSLLCFTPNTLALPRIVHQPSPTQSASLQHRLSLLIVAMLVCSCTPISSYPPATLCSSSSFSRAALMIECDGCVILAPRLALRGGRDGKAGHIGAGKSRRAKKRRYRAHTLAHLLPLEQEEESIQR